MHLPVNPAKNKQKSNYYTGYFQVFIQTFYFLLPVCIDMPVETGIDGTSINSHFTCILKVSRDMEIIVQ